VRSLAPRLIWNALGFFSVICPACPSWVIY